MESPTLCYSLLLGILAPPANTDHSCTCLSPHSLSLDTETPPVGQWQRPGREKPKKIKSDFCPPGHTSTNSSKSPRRILFSSNNTGFKEMFLNLLWVPGTTRNPMQNRMVWVLQMDRGTGSRLGWRNNMFSTTAGWMPGMELEQMQF